MIQAVKPNQIKLLPCAAGILGLALRAILYTDGVDRKGLLVAGYWAGTGVWILTAAVAAAVLLWCQKLNSSGTYEKAFPASALQAAGAALAGIACLLSPVTQPPAGNLSLIEPALRFVAAGSLIWIGYCRFRGKTPQFLLHSAVCVYLALRLVCQYRAWSADPQIQNYAFYLGAHVALMLTAYQFAALDAGCGDHRKLWLAGLAAVYLSAVSLYPAKEPFFLLCCIVWILTNLSRPSIRKRPAADTNHTIQEDLS